MKHVRAVIVLGILTTAFVAAMAQAASAEIVGPCTAFFNGIHFDDLDTPAEARERLVIPEGGALNFSGSVNADADFVAVDIVFSPWAYEILRESEAASEDAGDDFGSWNVDVPIGFFATYGQGIYEFRGRTDVCSGNAFFVVGDGPPWGSVIGQAAVGLAGAGVLMAAAGAWLPALISGGGGFVRCVFSGIPIGLGGAVLVQQAGLIPLSATSAGVGVAGGAVATTVIWQACSGLHGLFTGGSSAASAATAGGAASGTAAVSGAATLPPPPSFAPPSAPPPASGAGAPAPSAPAVAADPITPVQPDPIVKADPATAFQPDPTVKADPATAFQPDPTVKADPATAFQPDPTSIGEAKPPGGVTPSSASGAATSGTAPGGPAGSGAPTTAGSTGAAPGGTPPAATGAGAPGTPAGAGGSAASSASPASATGAGTGASATAGTATTGGAGAGGTAGGGTAAAAGGAGGAGSAAAGPAAAAGLPTGAGVDLAGLAAKGVLGLATTGALMKAKKAATRRAEKGDPGDVADLYWFYVDSPTAVYPTTGEDTITAYLLPGSWYLAKATYEQWVHTVDEDRGLEGFVAQYAVNRAEG